MPTPRYHDTGKHSFFGDLAYQRIVQRYPNHFLIALEHLFDWDKLSAELIPIYKGRGLVGRAPYAPAVILKLLFLCYLYDVSEREIEELADLNLLVKWFVGVAIDEPVPDHSTLSVFRKRLQADHQWQVLQRVFDELLQQGREQGIVIGDLQVLDSVHTRAHVDNAADREREDQGKPPRDPDARVVHKGKRTVVEADGQRTTKELTYKGFKTHVSIDASSQLIVSLLPSRGNMADNKAFPILRAHDRALGLPTTTYAGDRAYDDTDIYERLAAEHLQSAIRLNAYRTHKRNAHRDHWLAVEATPAYQRGCRLRYRVEQCFGIAKLYHGLEHCRYLGLLQYGFQSYLTCLVLNCKRMVKLLTGITLRPLAKGRKAEEIQPIYKTMPWAACA